MNTLSFRELVEKLSTNQVALASFGQESWHVVKTLDSIRYCEDSLGTQRGEIIQLTRSNMEAHYEIINV